MDPMSLEEPGLDTAIDFDLNSFNPEIDWRDLADPPQYCCPNLVQSETPNLDLFETTGAGLNVRNYGPDQPFGCNSLLTFSTVAERCQSVLNESNEPTVCDISARLSGMLFVVQDANEDSSRHAQRTSGLTCYRRNMLKVSGRAYVPRGARLQLGPDQMPLPITNIIASLSACETVAGQNVRLVVPPAKGSANQHRGVCEEAEPEPINLDMRANPDRYSEPCPFNISWDRLHFRHATTKSNRRNAPQQRFRLVLEIRGIAGGEHVILSRAISVPIDVRGRSPKSYVAQTDRRPAAKRPRNESSDSCSTAELSASLDEQINDLRGANVPMLSSVAPIAADAGGNTSEDWIAGLLAGNHEHSFNDMAKKNEERLTSRDNDTFASMLAGLADTDDSIIDGMDFGATPVPLSHHNQHHTSSSEDSEAVTHRDDEHSYEYFPLSALDWAPPAEAVYVR